MATEHIDRSQVDSTGENQDYWEGDYWDTEGEYDDFDADWQTDRSAESGRTRGEKSDRAPRSPYTTPTHNTAGKNAGPQTKLAQAGSFPPPQNQGLAQFIQGLKQQGYTQQQIEAKAMEAFGASPEEVDFQMNGYKNFPTFNKNMGQPAGPTMKAYQGYNQYGSMLGQYFQQQMYQQMKDKNYENQAESKKEMKLIQQIMLYIKMGNLGAALRLYAGIATKDMNKVARKVLEQLEKIRAARSKLVQEMGRRKTPRAYAGNDAKRSADTQNKTADYNNWLNMTNQAVTELDTSQREALAILQEVKQDNETLWQLVADVRNEENRTTRQVISSR